MTIEEARDLLAMIKVKEPGEFIVNSWWESFVNDYREALQMAIKALEQQPCEDDVSKFISRQMGLLEERMSSATNEGRWVEEEKCQYAIENLELVDEYIKAHPPVAPKEKTCEDAVSRQAILDIIMPYCQDDDGSVENTGDLRNALDDIESLPPVTPKEKTGKWIEIKSSKGTTIALRCSCCGNSPKRGISSDYCPNCGAKMQEVSE